MPEISLHLDVVGVDGQPIFDPRLEIFARRSNDTSLASWLMEPWQGARNLTFDAEEHLDFFLHVAPTRYELGALLYTVAGNRVATTQGRFCLPRLPSKWVPRFAPWQELPAGDFSALKELLAKRSPTFRCGRESAGGRFTDDRFDAVAPDNGGAALAKMSLLNFYSRLRVEQMPATTDSWLTQVSSLLYSDQERVVAEVSGTCWDIVRQTAQAPRDGFSGVNVVPSHISNFNAEPGVTDVTNAFSIKSGKAKANLQLTAAKARRHGQETFLLDVDFDENSNPVLHFFDVIRHKFSGGTHPIYIHECLRRGFGDAPLGYALQPRDPIPETDARIIDGAR
jgi:hypothetical protein